MPSQFATLIERSPAVTQSKVGHVKRFLQTDIFYEVLLVFYSLPITLQTKSYSEDTAFGRL